MEPFDGERFAAYAVAEKESTGADAGCHVYKAARARRMLARAKQLDLLLGSLRDEIVRKYL